jgi:hypothetical protein
MCNVAQTRSRNNYDSGKAVSITYFCACVRVWVSACMRVHACVYVGAQAWACACARLALIIQHITRMCHIVCGALWPHHIFQHYLTKSMVFGKKVLIIKCVLIFSSTFISNISRFEKNSRSYYHKYSRN